MTKTYSMKFVALFGAAAVFTAMLVPGVANGAVTLDPFTETELADNWIADRVNPSGGVESVSFDGRDDVVAIEVLGAGQDERGSFYYYEGIKKVSNFGDTVSIDLYVPEEWQDAETSPLNVGMWASDDPLTAYPLIVFRNGEEVDAGFYAYEYTFDENGFYESAIYSPSGVEVNYGDWNTLTVTLDDQNEVFIYMINGEYAGQIIPVTEDVDNPDEYIAGPVGDYIEQVYLNHYNNGDLDYTAYWHAGVAEPEFKQDCFDGAYEDYGFKNQGQCVRFVETGKDSR